MKNCTFCGREGSDSDRTIVVGGYTIFEYCTDCKKEILSDEEASSEHDITEPNKVERLGCMGIFPVSKSLLGTKFADKIDKLGLSHLIKE